jgi:hypothetical protein
VAGCLAFDLQRRAILLVGSGKSGVPEREFYKHLIDIADRRFDQHRRANLAKKGKG